MESIAKTMFAIDSNAQKDPKDAFLYHGERMMTVIMTFIIIHVEFSNWCLIIDY